MVREAGISEFDLDFTPILIRWAAIIVISGLLAWAIDSQWMAQEIAQEMNRI